MAPGDSDAMDFLGAAYRRAGHFDKAVGIYTKNFKLNPMRASTAADFAYTLGLAGEFDAARDVVRTGLTANPDAPYLLGASATVNIWNNDIDAAWQAARQFGFIDSGAYDFFRSQMVLYLRDDGKITALMENWPAPRNEAPFLDYFDLMRVIALRRLGETEESSELLGRLQPRIEAKLAENPLDNESRKIIIAIHGLRGDLERLRAAHEQMMANPPKDRLWLLEEGFVVVIAHAIAGENETALDLMEGLMDFVHPSQFARAELSPFFDDMRETPRYRALKARYAASLKAD